MDVSDATAPVNLLAQTLVKAVGSTSGRHEEQEQNELSESAPFFVHVKFTFRTIDINIHFVQNYF